MKPFYPGRKFWRNEDLFIDSEMVVCSQCETPVYQKGKKKFDNFALTLSHNCQQSEKPNRKSTLKKKAKK